MVSSGDRSRRASTTIWGLIGPPSAAARSGGGTPPASGGAGPTRARGPGAAAAAEPGRRARPSAQPEASEGRRGARSMTSAAVAGDGHVGAADLAQLGRVDVDVDDLGVRGEGVDLAGDPVVEARAQGDQQVGPLHGGDRGVVAVHARHAQALGVRVGEGAAGHEGGDHRDAGALGQRQEGLGGPGLQDPAAGVEDRPLGRQQQLGGPADLGRVALGDRVVAGQVEVVHRGRPVPLHRGVGHVLGHVDEDRAGPAGGGHVEGRGDHPGDVGRPP